MTIDNEFKKEVTLWYIGVGTMIQFQNPFCGYDTTNMSPIIHIPEASVGKSVTACGDDDAAS
jgi:hypothetical protein